MLRTSSARRGWRRVTRAAASLPTTRPPVVRPLTAGLPVAGPQAVRAAGRRLSGPVVIGAAAAAATMLVAVVSPEQPGHYPGCPTLALTGFYCPGCGGLRAVHALTHGDLALALHRNPLVVLGLPFVVWAYAAWLRRRYRDVPPRWLPSPGLIWAGAAVLVLFTVARNLPGGGWLGP